MFIAMDKHQERWNCMEEIPPVAAGPFYCLACQSEVRLKNGSVLRAHFAHVELQQCPYHHEAESMEHLELKASLYDWGSTHRSRIGVARVTANCGSFGCGQELRIGGAVQSLIIGTIKREK